MVKLNLGAGAFLLPGYVNIDRKTGTEAYPLKDYADESVDEVRASHVLEHFPHKDVDNVLKEWVRVLKPNGALKIAVPDFGWCAERYMAGERENVAGFIMGGQQDGDDYHRTLFDRGLLTDKMASAGIACITTWKSEAKDCASLPCSLNLQGRKLPTAMPKCVAVMSMPRLAFADNMFCAVGVMSELDILFKKTTGVYWGQCMERVMSQHLDDGTKYIISVDYDSVFQPAHVRLLIAMMESRPDIGALAPIQIKRGEDNVMLGLLQDDGTPYPVGTKITTEHFNGDYTRASWAHFGLTALRVSELKTLPHPWFHSKPNDSGEWGEGRVDDDIAFWRHWQANGKTLYLANRLALGHAQLMVTWPTKLGPTHQYPDAFWKEGMPAEVWR